MSFDLTYEVFIVPVSWLILFVTLVILMIRKQWKRAGIVFLGGAVVLGSLVVVPPGHRGVIFSANGGVNEVERNEGVSLMIPLFQSANMVNVREKKYENLEVYAQTKDLLEVTVQIGVNYYIQPTNAAELFRDIGKNYELAIIEPAVLDISKRQIGLVEAIDFPSQREQLAADITADLAARLGPRGIEVTYVAIQDNIFNPSFVSAVLAKEIADEKASESLKLVQVATNEASAVAARAEGDARAAALQGEGQGKAITKVAEALGFDPQQYLAWLQLQVWDGNLPMTYVGDLGNLNLLLGVP